MVSPTRMPIDSDIANIFFQLIAKRYEKNSTIITTNMPFSRWGEYFGFTPKHGSWLNMIEGFFSKMTRQMLRGIRVKSKAELADRIYLYFEEANAEPVVFHWKYNLDDVDVSEEVIVDTLPLKKSS